VAAVVLKQDETMAVQDLIAWANQRVGAKFQRLHHVVFYGEFPRNIAGKTLKREMREAYRKVP
jgi:long-chain acyl-CoA synthetase